MAILMLHLTSMAILMLSLINTAHAHYVWLERDGEGSAYAYFGEWVDDIREKAGGLLDRIKAPRAFLGASTTPLPIKRHEDKLEITVSGKGDLRLVENGVPPRDDSEKGGITRTIYYAKAGRSETAAKLDLELVPTAAEGNTLVLAFLRRTSRQNGSYRDWAAEVGKAFNDRRAGSASPYPPPGLAATFWKLPISKRNRVAPEMTSLIAPATLHRSRSCSGTGRRGPPNANT